MCILIINKYPLCDVEQEEVSECDERKSQREHLAAKPRAARVPHKIRRKTKVYKTRRCNECTACKQAKKQSGPLSSLLQRRLESAKPRSSTRESLTTGNRHRKVSATSGNEKSAKSTKNTSSASGRTDSIATDRKFKLLSVKALKEDPEYKSNRKIKEYYVEAFAYVQKKYPSVDLEGLLTPQDVGGKRSSFYLSNYELLLSRKSDARKARKIADDGTTGSDIHGSTSEVDNNLHAMDGDDAEGDVEEEVDEEVEEDVVEEVE